VVVKPLSGIENQKYHPIIKNMDDIDISITPYQMTPLNAVTRPFINQLKSFNEYNERSQQQHHNQSLQQRPSNKKQQRSLAEKHGSVLEGISEDGPNESLAEPS
jgi:hypothetical protein